MLEHYPTLEELQNIADQLTSSRVCELLDDRPAVRTLVNKAYALGVDIVEFKRHKEIVDLTATIRGLEAALSAKNDVHVTTIVKESHHSLFIALIILLATILYFIFHA